MSKAFCPDCRDDRRVDAGGCFLHHLLPNPFGKYGTFQCPSAGKPAEPRRAQVEPRGDEPDALQERDA